MIDELLCNNSFLVSRGLKEPNIFVTPLTKLVVRPNQQVSDQRMEQDTRVAG
jgi:hypothetical protein